MLVTFVALCTAAAIVVRRPWHDKAVIALSAAPIAVLVNVLRITATGVLYETAGARLAELVFHDLAGWLMMPVALALVGLELLVLGRLFVPAADKVSAPSPLGPVPLSPLARVQAGRGRKRGPAALPQS
jgi:exosortase/archaeosortase family protein